jgi:hypothetical protein
MPARANLGPTRMNPKATARNGFPARLNALRDGRDSDGGLGRIAAPHLGGQSVSDGRE